MCGWGSFRKEDQEILLPTQFIPSGIGFRFLTSRTNNQKQQGLSTSNKPVCFMLTAPAEQISAMQKPNKTANGMITNTARNRKQLHLSAMLCSLPAVCQETLRLSSLLLRFSCCCCCVILNCNLSIRTVCLFQGCFLLGPLWSCLFIHTDVS